VPEENQRRGQSRTRRVQVQRIPAGDFKAHNNWGKLTPNITLEPQRSKKRAEKI